MASVLILALARVVVVVIGLVGGVADRSLSMACPFSVMDARDGSIEAVLVWGGLAIIHLDGVAQRAARAPPLTAQFVDELLPPIYASISAVSVSSGFTRSVVVLQGVY